jgi:hypothetical protein
VLLGFARHRRVDAVGVLVLAGVAVGTILGLVTGNERLILAEGSVPTAIFGLACLGSLRGSRPLIFRFALEFIGADTLRGRDFATRWPGERFAVGSRWPVEGDNLSTLVLDTGRPARLDRYDDSFGPLGSAGHDVGIRSSGRWRGHGPLRVRRYAHLRRTR